MTSYANTAEIDGKQWAWVYLNTDTRMPESDRDIIAMEAIRLYNKKEKKKDIKGKTFEGRITRKGEAIVGGFIGREYEALVETDHGRSLISFLMKPERIDPSWN